MTRLPTLLTVACLLACSGTASAQCNFSMNNIFTVTPGAAQPRSVVVADFNGDGIPDVATCTPVTNLIYCSLGVGNGNFGAPIQSVVPAGPAGAMVAGDLNGDGRVDLALACTATNSIVLFIGNGAGSFSQVASIPCNGSSPVAIALGDIDNDTKQDLLWVNSGSSSYAMARNLGAGNFSLLPAQSSGGANPQGLALADFNGDGRLDLAICNQSSSSIATFAGNGSGGFTQYANMGLGNAPTAIAAADLNGDGRPDLAVANSASGTLSWVFSTGPGFSALAATTPIANYRAICIADLNNDGRPDLIGTSSSPNVTNVYLGLGGGTFGPANALPAVAGGPWGLAAGDFNLDGRLDLAVAFNSSNVTLAYQNTSTTPPAITTQPTNTTVITGHSASFTVAATGANIGYQWRRNSVNLMNGGAISGANSPTLTINPATLADNLSYYDVTVINPCGSVTSVICVLGVTSCAADFNHDGSVDFFDYLDFVDAYSLGC